MKVIIEPGKVPEIYGDDGQLIDRIVSLVIAMLREIRKT